ncbi:MAG: hypothetical protein AAGH15_27550, partial [Myxococcota bacterium]
MSADWPHGVGPQFVVGRRPAHSPWVASADPLAIDHPELDAPVRVRAFPPSSHWLLRRAFSPEIVELFGESIKSDGRTVTAIWTGALDTGTVDGLL